MKVRFRYAKLVIFYGAHRTWLFFFFTSRSRTVCLVLSFPPFLGNELKGEKKVLRPNKR